MHNGAPTGPDAFDESHTPEIDLSEIVLATGNPHKVEELRAIFDRLLPSGRDGGASVEVKSLEDFGGGFVEPVEDGGTFAENAGIKAVSYAEQTGRACLADDSGLEVDALGGAPGVISSHYFCDGRPDASQAALSRGERDRLNNERLLRALEGVAPEKRTARFVCVMALAAPALAGEPGRVVATVRGTFEGRIGLVGEAPRGEHGFGYDPLFLVAPEYVKTSAELSPEAKNLLSHRGRAAEAMARAMARLLG